MNHCIYFTPISLRVAKTWVLATLSEMGVKIKPEWNREEIIKNQDNEQFSILMLIPVNIQIKYVTKWMKH